MKKFEGLHTLILGSGSGGWVPEAYSDTILSALPRFNRLQHFSLKYDCTELVLKVLSESCSKTLRVLDVERSLQVKDQICVDYILCFKNLVEINIFKTGLQDNEICQILVGLKNIIQRNHIFSMFLSVSRASRFGWEEVQMPAGSLPRYIEFSCVPGADRSVRGDQGYE